MAYTNGWYDNWESDECSDESLTGQCDGYVPDDDKDAPGAECSCTCHSDDFDSVESARLYHEAKHRDAQDGAYHNIPDAN